MFEGRLNNFETHAIDPLQAKFHHYARSRPSSTWGIMQQKTTVADANARSQPSSTMQPKQFANKKAML